MFTHTKTPMTAIHQRQKHKIDTLVEAAKEVIAADDASLWSYMDEHPCRWDRAMGALAAAVTAAEEDE